MQMLKMCCPEHARISSSDDYVALWTKGHWTVQLFFFKNLHMFYNSKNRLTSVRNAHFKVFFYISRNFKKESAVESLTANGSSGEVMEEELSSDKGDVRWIPWKPGTESRP